jgi:hypothetical protein
LRPSHAQRPTAPTPRSPDQGADLRRQVSAS